MDAALRVRARRAAPIDIHGIPLEPDGTPIEPDSLLGTPESHGCVRMNQADAEFVWNWATVGTTVVVTDLGYWRYRQRSSPCSAPTFVTLPTAKQIRALGHATPVA